MTVADGEILRMSVRQLTSISSDVVNVFHCRCDFTDTQTDADVLQAVEDWMDEAYQEVEAYINDGCSPEDIKVDVVALVSGVWEIVRNVGTTSWGTLYIPAAADSGMPYGIAALVILRTLVGKVFGRKFIGLVTEAGIEGNNAIAGFITALLDFGAFYIADWIVSAGNYLAAGVISTRTLAFEEFTEIVVGGKVGYQRRRAPGRGS